MISFSSLKEDFRVFWVFQNFRTSLCCSMTLTMVLLLYIFSVFQGFDFYLPPVCFTPLTPIYLQILLSPENSSFLDPSHFCEKSTLYTEIFKILTGLSNCKHQLVEAKPQCITFPLCSRCLFVEVTSSTHSKSLHQGRSGKILVMRWHNDVVAWMGLESFHLE